MCLFSHQNIVRPPDPNSPNEMKVPHSFTDLHSLLECRQELLAKCAPQLHPKLLGQHGYTQVGPRLDHLSAIRQDLAGDNLSQVWVGGVWVMLTG